MEKYQIIYADPPWQYRNAKGTGVAENHYKTMSVEEICSLPVKEWTDKKCCVVFMGHMPTVTRSF